MAEYKTGKMDREILCIKSNLLEGLFSGKDFVYNEKINILDKINKRTEYLRRGPLENDSHYRQIIPYTILINGKDVFVYRRSNKVENYSETRLYEKYSLGVGGHTEKTKLKNVENILVNNAIREIKEETSVRINSGKLKLFGYIKLNYDVHKYHLSICYLAQTKSKNVKFRDKEITNGEYLNIDEIIRLSKKVDMEDWSKILLKPLQTLLRK
ncbi:MAG: hypothetical protein ABI721_05635 [Candidatus Dojkabacteria bacterium]